MGGTVPGTQIPSTGDPTIDAVIAAAVSGNAARSQVDQLDTLLGLNPMAPIYQGQRQEETGYWSPGGTAVGTRPVDRTKTVGQLLERFYKFDSAQLRRYQYDLYLGGYYGNNADPRQIQWGVADRTSYEAWTRLVVDASRHYAAGKDIMPKDVLALAKQAAARDGDDDEDGPTIAQLSDPAALAQMVNEMSRKLLGRGTTPEEERLFVATMHAQQRSNAEKVTQAGRRKQPDTQAMAAALSAGNDADYEQLLAEYKRGRGGTVDVIGVSPEAQAEDWLHRKDNVAYDSNKMIRGLRAAFSMFGGEAS